MTFTVLDAPSNLGLRPPAPGRRAGRAAAGGRAARVRASWSGSARATPARVDAPPYVDAAANRAAHPRATRGRWPTRIGELLDAGERPAGARRRLQHPARRDARAAPARPLRAGASSTGTSTSATRAGRAGSAPSRARTSRASPGRRSPSWRTSTGSARTCADADVVALGEREGDPGERARWRDRDPRARPRRAARAERSRAGGAVLGPRGRRRARQRLCPRSTRPRPDGLTFDELTALLRELLAGDAVGMQVTVFDPDLDPGRLTGAGADGLPGEGSSRRLRRLRSQAMNHSVGNKKSQRAIPAAKNATPTPALIVRLNASSISPRVIGRRRPSLRHRPSSQSIATGTASRIETWPSRGRSQSSAFLSRAGAWACVGGITRSSPPCTTEDGRDCWSVEAPRRRERDVVVDQGRRPRPPARPRPARGPSSALERRPVGGDEAVGSKSSRGPPGPRALRRRAARPGSTIPANQSKAPRAARGWRS